MAFSLSTLAWKASLNGGCKTVLLSLCDSANTRLDPQHYECWPMMETIALYCGTSVRSVQNHINQLLKDGYISRRRRFMMSSVYRIELTKLRADAEKFDALMRARKEAWAAKTSGFDATAAVAEVASLPANPAPLPEDSAPLPANFAVYDQQILQTEPVIQPVDKPIKKTSPAPTVVTPAAATPAARPLVVKEIPEIPEDLFAAWIAVRKTKNRKVLTTVELDEIRQEGAKAGLSLADTILSCVKSNWARFEAHWLQKTPAATVPSATPVAPAVLEKMAAQEAAPVQDVSPLPPHEREAFRAAAERIKSTMVVKRNLAWAEEAIALRRAGEHISYGRLKMAMDALGLSTWREVSCAT
ncbi:MAG: helix-turn-helix domain-containing protein [Burkholderiaceae bacterium]|nr:helix-turn-helix domain-containing protein [Burkholderiaceae bacterium]